MKNITEVMPILKGIRQEKKITIKEVVEYLEQVANVSVAEKNSIRMGKFIFQTRCYVLYGVV